MTASISISVIPAFLLMFVLPGSVGGRGDYTSIFVIRHSMFVIRDSSFAGAGAVGWGVFDTTHVSTLARA
jgi:hypothetical protein